MTRNSVRNTVPKVPGLLKPLCACLLAATSYTAGAQEAAADVLLAPGKTVVVVDDAHPGVAHEITAPADRPLDLTRALGGASSSGFGSDQRHSANSVQVGADGRIMLRAVHAQAAADLPTIDGGTVRVGQGGIVIYGNVVSGALPAAGASGALPEGRPLLNPLGPSEALAAARGADVRLVAAMPASSAGAGTPAIFGTPVFLRTTPVVLPGNPPVLVSGGGQSSGAIVSMQSFNIAGGQGITFIQSGGAAAFNQPASGNVTLNGNLSANGQPFGINPNGFNGVVTPAGARVNAGAVTIK